MPSLAILDTSKVSRAIRAFEMVDTDGTTTRNIQTLSIVAVDLSEKLVFQYFNAAASPASVFGSGSSGGTIAITTDPSTATPTGGTAPYTYAWTQTSGAGLWTANQPTNPISDFTGYAIGAGDGDDATFICTITDSLGATAITNDVACSVTNYG